MSLFAPAEDRSGNKPDPKGPVKSWSYSRLTTFEKCQYAVKLQVIDKHKDEGSAATQRGGLIHTMCEQYIRGEIDKIDPELVVGCHDAIEQWRTLWADPTRAGEIIVEQKWAFTEEWKETEWFDKDTWTRIILDLCYIDGSHCVIRDWKSGKKDGNEIKHRQQGELYGIAVCMKFPEIDTFDIGFEYVDHDKAMTWKTNRAILLRSLPGWNRRAGALTAETVFKPSPSRFTCKWCFMKQFCRYRWEE